MITNAQNAAKVVQRGPVYPSLGSPQRSRLTSHVPHRSQGSQRQAATRCAVSVPFGYLHGFTRAPPPPRHRTVPSPPGSSHYRHSHTRPPPHPGPRPPRLFPSLPFCHVKNAIPWNHATWDLCRFAHSLHQVLKVHARGKLSPPLPSLPLEILESTFKKGHSLT